MGRLNKTLVFVVILDVVALIISFILFKYLNSEAKVDGTDLGLGTWQASGALAGFVIVLAVNFYFIKTFSPKGAEAHPSYPAVSEFYKNLQAKNYTGAWKLISLEMQQKRWRNEESRFVDGFINTQGINLLAVDFVSILSSVSHEYVVYYQEKTETPVLPGLEKLGDWDVRSLPDLNAKIIDLRKRLIENGIEPSSLDGMKIAQLITAIRGDILRWRISNTSAVGNLDVIFPTFKMVSRLVGKRITVGLHDKKWLIDSVEDIPYNEE